jgi:hypothetical protein
LTYASPVVWVVMNCSRREAWCWVNSPNCRLRRLGAIALKGTFAISKSDTVLNGNLRK